MLDKLKKHNGFTMVEILIGIVVGAIVMGAIYSTYTIQSKSAVVHEQVSEMQQNLRSALYMMERDIRMAGLNPMDDPILFIISTAATNSITFSADFDRDGVLAANETITYLITAGTTNLCRDDTNGVQPPVLLAGNIQALGFGYGFDNDGDDLIDVAAGNTIWAVDTDGDGSLDATPDINGDGFINAADFGGTVGLGYTVPLANIRVVRIWLLARTGRQDLNFVDRNTYAVADQNITPNDSFRHRLLTTTVICRNMGL